MTKAKIDRSKAEIKLFLSEAYYPKGIDAGPQTREIFLPKGPRDPIFNAFKYFVKSYKCKSGECKGVLTISWKPNMMLMKDVVVGKRVQVNAYALTKKIRSNASRTGTIHSISPNKEDCVRILWDGTKKPDIAMHIHFLEPLADQMV